MWMISPIPRFCYHSCVLLLYNNIFCSKLRSPYTHHHELTDSRLLYGCHTHVKQQLKIGDQIFIEMIAIPNMHSAAHTQTQINREEVM